MSRTAINLDAANLPSDFQAPGNWEWFSAADILGGNTTTLDNCRYLARNAADIAGSAAGLYFLNQDLFDPALVQAGSRLKILLRYFHDLCVEAFSYYDSIYHEGEEMYDAVRDVAIYTQILNSRLSRFAPSWNVPPFDMANGVHFDIPCEPMLELLGQLHIWVRVQRELQGADSKKWLTAGGEVNLLTADGVNELLRGMTTEFIDGKNVSAYRFASQQMGYPKCIFATQRSQASSLANACLLLGSAVPGCPGDWQTGILSFFRNARKSRITQPIIDEMAILYGDGNAPDMKKVRDAAKSHWKQKLRPKKGQIITEEEIQQGVVRLLQEAAVKHGRVWAPFNRLDQTARSHNVFPTNDHPDWFSAIVRCGKCRVIHDYYLNLESRASMQGGQVQNTGNCAEDLTHAKLRVLESMAPATTFPSPLPVSWPNNVPPENPDEEKKDGGKDEKKSGEK
ncbi:hypothetical protein LTS15_005218 [Exophiala xenobiotica]|nr:hypothetical protein LTS15_005218 [Exophiala xenobiotica]